jgi:hypothetical protein
MKHLFLKSILFLAFIVTFHTTANCQVREILEAMKPEKAYEGTPILKKGSHVIQVGIGMGSNIVSLAGLGEVGNLLGSAVQSNATSKVGPFTFGYEYLIKDNLGLGINISYAEGTQTSSSSVLGISLGPAYTTTVKSTTILLSTTYHLYTTDKFDPYSKISIGATLWSGTNKNANGSDAGSIPTFPTPIAYDAVLGLRYFAGKQMGLYGELSYSNLSFAANIGLTFKLH